jgi:hypothetical protein
MSINRQRCDGVAPGTLDGGNGGQMENSVNARDGSRDVRARTNVTLDDLHSIETRQVRDLASGQVVEDSSAVALRQ